MFKTVWMRKRLLKSSQVDLLFASIPGLGRCPAEGNGNPLQYSSLENFMDRRAWWATSMGSQRVRHNWACICRDINFWLLCFHLHLSQVFFFHWSIVDLQCYISFRCTIKWFSYTCILFQIPFYYYEMLHIASCAIQ